MGKQLLEDKEIVGKPSGLQKINDNFTELYDKIERITSSNQQSSGTDVVPDMATDEIVKDIESARSIADLKATLLKLFKPRPEV